MIDRISLEMQIACVRRELALRQRVYPKWVAAGKMKQAEADKELTAMQAVHDTLSALIRSPDARERLNFSTDDA